MLRQEFSDGDVKFLVETVKPGLLTKVDVIKSDPGFIEGMLDQESGRLFERLMFNGDPGVTASVTPRFLFEVLLRRTLREMEVQSFTVERASRYKVPVFDSYGVVRFLSDKAVLKYLAGMLTSFTRVESFTLPVRVRKGVWRRIHFSDMDIDSLMVFCQAVAESERFGFYRRIADLCLFILGMFPEYAAPGGGSLAGKAKPGLARRLTRSAAEYEELGRRFYKLAAEHKNAANLGLTETFFQLHRKFSLAQKPVNYISQNFLRFRREEIFPSLLPK